MDLLSRFSTESYTGINQADSRSADCQDMPCLRPIERPLRIFEKDNKISPDGKVTAVRGNIKNNAIPAEHSDD